MLRHKTPRMLLNHLWPRGGIAQWVVTRNIWTKSRYLALGTSRLPSATEIRQNPGLNFPVALINVDLALPGHFFESMIYPVRLDFLTPGGPSGWLGPYLFFWLNS